MVGITISENESIDKALKRFKKKYERSGVLKEFKKRTFFVKPSVKKRLERIKARNVKTKLDEIIEERPQLASDLEREIQRVLCKERNYFELNTDEMNIDEVTEEIYRRII